MTKTQLIDAIVYAPSDEVPIWATNGILCKDLLLKVGFHTYVDNVSDTRFIVFRPTMNRLNWTLDFIFPLYTIPYGNKNTPIRIHSGFLAAYMSLRDEIHHIIVNNSCKNIVFGGHSLGGALARLSAVDVQYSFNVQPVVYTMGAPNIGNEAFEISFNKRIEHSIYYINNKDPVPAAPFQWMGYKRYIRTRLPKKYIWRFWLNHLPEVYIKNLEEHDTAKEIL